MPHASPAPRPGNMALGIVALVWAGMVIGVSGLATPIKFQAPSLSLPVALEVGQVTFRAFSRIEWGLAVLLALSLILSGLRARLLLWLPAGLVIAIVLAQAVWLLPILDARIDAVIAGNPLPPSGDHFVYVIAEGAKLAALFVIGLAAICKTQLAGRAQDVDVI